MSNTILGMRRFLQQPSECSFAASTAVGHFYNKDIDYAHVREIGNAHSEGLWTPQIASLLNKIGFSEVTVVTGDIRQLDFDWKNLTKRQLINRLSNNKKKYPDSESRQITKHYLDFLNNKECNNSIIIDIHFGKYIRKYINQNKPILASFNWNLFFNQPKKNNKGINDPIKGNFEEHEVVIYGYNESGVYILDSHHECYHGPLAKFRTGRYHMKWDTLHTVMGFGDLILPDKYDFELFEKYNELVQTN